MVPVDSGDCTARLYSAYNVAESVCLLCAAFSHDNLVTIQSFERIVLSP
jgi:hypothetical protein